MFDPENSGIMAVVDREEMLAGLAKILAGMALPALFNSPVA